MPNGTFEAIKRSPFSGGNSFARPISEKASAEMIAFACLKFKLPKSNFEF